MKNRLLAWSFVLALIAVMSVVAWLHDFVTLQGGRTVYTAECAGGEWRGPVCTGHLAAGDRYRFRPQKVRGEVLFWVAGSTQPSGKLTKCAIENAKNWECKPGADSPRSITLAMRHGQPDAGQGSGARVFHAVPKWKWLMLDAGFTHFQEADDSQ